ncbi:MAG: hypothetical protein Q8M29_10870 [Bacteroidota bacterium]|nr:hypothetical protein [Bacteroidota bacterium]
MKRLFLILLSVLTLNSFSQSVPAKGDYISCKTLGYEPTNYIYKNRMVFYGYSSSTKKSENSYKQNAKMVKELFKMADAAGFDKIKSLDENSLLLEQGDYKFQIIEYRKGNKTYRVCWDSYIEDTNYLKLNQISGKMNSFW